MDGEAAGRTQPSQTVIVVPRAEWNIRRFHGDGPAMEVEEFLQAIERAWRAQHIDQPEERCEFLISHLGEEVKTELACHPQTTRTSPEALARVLRATYGERRSVSQLTGELYRVSQHPGEPIRSYSHRMQRAFQAVVDRQKALSATPVDEIVLRDRFVENLHDRVLRRHLLEKLNDMPENSFLTLRDTAIRWAEDDHHSPQPTTTKLVCQETKVEGQLAALSRQVEELSAQLLRLQAARPSKSGCHLCGSLNHLARDCRQKGNPRANSGRSGSMKCFHCGSPNHFARACPKNANPQ